MYLLPAFVSGSGPIRSIPTLCHTLVTGIGLGVILILASEVDDLYADICHSSDRTSLHLHAFLSNKTHLQPVLYSTQYRVSSLVSPKLLCLL